jgi:polar amino acid transport system substrate-binding protein
MHDHRRGVSVLAIGAASLALLATPFAAAAQDDTGTALVSEQCQAANLDSVLKNPGRLTLSTDNPAWYPWFSGAVPEGSDWASYGQYPPSGEGFEGAMAYAIARVIGFQPDQVDWIGQSEFGLAFAPGEKDFDFHLGQVAITDARAQVVDFSDPYYDATQSIVALADNPIAKVTTLAGLKDFQLGAPGNTTSFRVIEDVIQPNVEPKAPQDVATATQQLVNGQIDGLVVDTPSGFYIRDAELPFEPFEKEGVIVGQIMGEGGERFGLVLEKGSPLTTCVNEAIAVLRESGERQAIEDAWISGDAPVLR